MQIYTHEFISIMMMDRLNIFDFNGLLVKPHFLIFISNDEFHNKPRIYIRFSLTLKGPCLYLDSILVDSLDNKEDMLKAYNIITKTIYNDVYNRITLNKNNPVINELININKKFKSFEVYKKLVILYSLK